MKLLTNTAHVQSPFIIVKIGNYTFGQYSKDNTTNMYGKGITVTFPNMVQSLTVNKVNGVVNQYSVQLIYQIAAGQDPNFMEQVFSQISGTRRMYISYGDWNQPHFIYKEEEVFVSKIQTQFDFASSRITYTVSAVSTCSSLSATLWTFGRRVDKPSNVIISILKNKMYGLQDIFTGMTNIDKVLQEGLIPSSDAVVNIPSKTDINVLDYLSYLVSCMTCTSNDPKDIIHDSVYRLSVYDDITNTFGGTYFKIVKVPAVLGEYVSKDIYEVDVGYPSDNFVTKFELTNNDSWAIMYNIAQVNQNNYSYMLDNQGNRITTGAPEIVQSRSTKEITESNKNWWTQMTKFPVSAQLEIQGLLRPAMLMQNVKINSYFYGQKFIASGIYFITKQIDSVSGRGFKTTLYLQRYGGDTEEDSAMYKNYTPRVTTTGSSTTHLSSSGNIHGGGGRHF